MSRMYRKRRHFGPIILSVLVIALLSAALSQNIHLCAAPFHREPDEPPQNTGVPEAEEPETEQPREEPLPPVPEEPAEAVDDTYFSDAVFLGNSRTEGFHLYSGLTNGQFFYATGATVDTVFNKSTWTLDGRSLPLLDAVQVTAPGKIYVMLGVNELGWVRTDLFREHYGKVVDRLRADHPDAKLILQSIIPVTRTQEEKHTYVNNGRIAQYNDLIRTLAQEKECFYLDVQMAVTDDAGFLRQELSFDGIHLNPAGCRLWLAYLKNHAV